MVETLLEGKSLGKNILLSKDKIQENAVRLFGEFESLLKSSGQFKNAEAPYYWGEEEGHEGGIVFYAGGRKFQVDYGHNVQSLIIYVEEPNHPEVWTQVVVQVCKGDNSQHAEESLISFESRKFVTTPDGRRLPMVGRLKNTELALKNVQEFKAALTDYLKSA